MYGHILIATDGSELAHRAVTHGLDLAKAVGAKATVLIVEAPLNVYDLRPSQQNQISQVFEEHAKHIKDHAAIVLSDAAAHAEKMGVSCETLQIEHVQPYEGIIKTAKDKGCDVIVMASHGRGGISAVLLGSVTNKVLTHTKIPVLVCH